MTEAGPIPYDWRCACGQPFVDVLALISHRDRTGHDDVSLHIPPAPRPSFEPYSGPGPWPEDGVPLPFEVVLP